MICLTKLFQQKRRRIGYILAFSDPTISKRDSSERKNDKNMKLNRIRAVLEDKGISQTWLAKKLGRSFSTVNAYVCNRSQPNLTTLLEIAQLLSVDMKELITDETERTTI